MPTVAEIMERDPVTVSPEDTVETLLRTLRDHELPGVPVVNGGGRPIGIVTEADLVMVDEEEDLRLPLHIDLFGAQIFLGPVKRFEERFKKAIAATVGEMMTPDPITVDSDTDVREAARIIAERRHNRLPVVEHGRLVGVVTRLDVLEALVDDQR
ncbi:CBS domain-containing protein [Conexibacter arvalis]|uniref:CBS domain-containing protein n=1 Tax=Conexibacter arvalis TaxID=912552 RepID=A0A840IEN8_9ACTN|nr:CBS domain-containing protein [Conexibacter arvalis]MBB4662468.1 CBS domain-containing protein [Conexibacter arvalis]